MNSKKKIVFIITFLALVGVSFLFGYSYNARKAYFNNIDVIKKNRQTGVFSLPYHYFLKDEICPSSMSELYYYIKDAPLDIWLSQFLTDPFSDDLNQVNLIPLFNKASSRWEGVLILSAGIDGKMNYEYTLKDTIFIDEYKSLDLFYNSVDDISLDIHFNPIDLFWGKKDLLISYHDCRESFKKSGKFWGIKDLDSLIIKVDDRLRTGKSILNKQIYTVDLNSNKKAWENDTLISELKNGYIVSFHFYDHLELERFKRAGERRLVGKLTDVDGERKEAKFIMCMNPVSTDL